MDNSKYDTLRLENQLCFPLYAASREIIKNYKPFLDELDLTYTQYITLMLLWENKNMRVKEIGEMLYLDSGTLTPLLKKLEGKGLITRARSPEDERNLNVTITEAGEELRDRALDIPTKIMATTGLTAEETEALYHLLYQVLSAVKE